MQKLLVVVEKVLQYKILTIKDCIYCVRAKMLCNQYGVGYQEKRITDEKEIDWLKRQGFKTFPIIYDSKDNHIGGYLEFMEYLHEKNS